MVEPQQHRSKFGSWISAVGVAIAIVYGGQYIFDTKERAERTDLDHEKVTGVRAWQSEARKHWETEDANHREIRADLQAIADHIGAKLPPAPAK